MESVTEREELSATRINQELLAKLSRSRRSERTAWNLLIGLVGLCCMSACNKEASSIQSKQSQSTTTQNPAQERRELAALPALTLRNHRGQSFELDKLGVPSVIYFYPKDDTPGCTTEAKGFRDAWEQLSALGVMVIGVSTDDDESHHAFAEKHELPFDLIADPNKKVLRAFGVPSTLGFAKRMTFVADAQGHIIKRYSDVEPSQHAAEIVTLLQHKLK